MQKIQKYDLIIIGGGSAGLTAAETAVLFNKKIALVAERIGGDCLWTGCVPSKSLLSVAREVKGKNLALQDAWDLAKARINGSIHTIQSEHDNARFYEKLGVKVYEGKAKFVDSHSVKVNDQVLKGKKFLICTGSRVRVPNISGLENVQFYTNENIFTLSSLPKSFVVIGGGPIGCELGQALQRLGSEVTILQRDSRLMSHDELQASKVVLESLLRDGVQVYLDTQVNSVAHNAAGISISVTHKGETMNLETEAMLLATGRQPNIETMGLEVAGVKHDDRGIIHDKFLRTSKKHIFVAGDVAGDFQFTHFASSQAGVAVQNIFIPIFKASVTSIVPWCTFTSPEVAHTGLTTAMAEDQNVQYETTMFPYHNIDRAITENKTNGFIQLLIGKNEKIIGATIVGERAGEVIQELTLAISQKMSVQQLLQVIHVYPTYSSGLQQALFDRFNSVDILLLRVGRIVAKLF